MREVRLIRVPSVLGQASEVRVGGFVGTGEREKPLESEHPLQRLRGQTGRTFAATTELPLRDVEGCCEQADAVAR
jgi:hypothetical protein